MFTKIWWGEEVAAFEAHWAVEALSEERAALLVRGLIFLTHCTRRHHPDDKEFQDEILGSLRATFAKARARYGSEWFAKHMQVFNNHALPCGQAPCPCGEFLTRMPT